MPSRNLPAACGSSCARWGSSCGRRVDRSTASPVQRVAELWMTSHPQLLTAAGTSVVMVSPCGMACLGRCFAALLMSSLFMLADGPPGWIGVVASMTPTHKRAVCPARRWSVRVKGLSDARGPACPSGRREAMITRTPSAMAAQKGALGATKAPLMPTATSTRPRVTQEHPYRYDLGGSGADADPGIAGGSSSLSR